LSRPRRKERPAAAQGWLSRAEWGTALLLTAFALCLHAAHFAKGGALWRDEVNSVEYATMPSLRAIYGSLQYDSFPIGSTLALRGWTAVTGSSDQGFRLFGLLVGVAFLVSIWVASRSLGRALPLFSIAFVGLSTWVIRTIDSIRPYGIGVVFLVLTLAWIWKAVASPSGRAWWLAGALAILSVQCMYQNAFLLLGMCLAAGIVLLWTSRKGDLLRLGAVGAAAAASLLIYVPAVTEAREWTVLVRDPFPLKILWDRFSTATGLEGTVKPWLWLLFVLTGSIFGIRTLLARGRPGTSARVPSPVLFGALFALGAAAIYLVAIKSAGVPPQAWYYVPLLAAIAPALDAANLPSGAPKRISTSWRVAKLALVLGLAAVTSVSVEKGVTTRRTNVDAVASLLNQRAAAGDLIVIYPFYYAVDFHRYYTGSAPWLTLPPIEDARVHRYDLLRKAMSRPDPLRPALQKMVQALSSGHRVWLLGGLRNPKMGQPAPSIPPPPLPGSGWYAGPYFEIWGEEAAYFLSQHVAKVETVPDPVTEETCYEHYPLLIASGWR
jgi:Dolichyl-phosphate-mannose-protein mannosyltransferase